MNTASKLIVVSLASAVLAIIIILACQYYAVHGPDWLLVATENNANTVLGIVCLIALTALLFATVIALNDIDK